MFNLYRNGKKIEVYEDGSQYLIFNTFTGTLVGTGETAKECALDAIKQQASYCDYSIYEYLEERGVITYGEPDKSGNQEAIINEKELLEINMVDYELAYREHLLIESEINDEDEDLSINEEDL